MVVGVAAHVDAGKTTFCEQLLLQTHTIRSAGRVDNGNSFMDVHPLERRRGITIFSGQAKISWLGREHWLLDTPGHVDFSAEMERALQVIDCAVIIISCAEGVQGHTETLFRLLEKYQIPAFLFLNKTDRIGADSEKVLAEINGLLGRESTAVDFSGCGDAQSENTFWDSLSSDLKEEIAPLSERLFEAYLDQRDTTDLWRTEAQSLFRQRKLFPVFRGAALLGQGIEEFLTGLTAFCWEEPSNLKELPFMGKVYQVRRDSAGNRIVSVKVQQGTLQPKSRIACVERNGEIVEEKAAELRFYQGEKFSPAQSAGPGELCAVCGLASPMPGDRIGENPQKGSFQMVPTLVSRVTAKEPQKLPIHELLSILRTLEEEDPTLQVQASNVSGGQEIHVKIMGQIQLEILTDCVRQRFGADIVFGPCRVLYRETLSAPVIGMGHFEPLRHYAEVHFLLLPGEPGSGIRFSSRVHTDNLSLNWQHLVETHVMEKSHLGTMTGSEITDIQIILIAARAHEKHTEGGDFRQSVYRAIRQGFASALQDGKVQLLEPVYRVSIQVPQDLAGRVLSDIQQRKGAFQPPELENGRAKIIAKVPAASFLDYPLEFAGFSRGKGSLSMDFDGYTPCHNPDEVTAEIGYDFDRDVENTADSVFCAKGAGFPVKWFDVPSYAHLSPDTPKELL